jgi:hypothetical protein
MLKPSRYFRPGLSAKHPLMSDGKLCDPYGAAADRPDAEGIDFTVNL